MVKNLPSMQEMYVGSLVREDPLEEGMATHSSILAWRIPWTEEPGGLQSTVSQRLGHDRGTNPFTLLRIQLYDLHLSVHLHKHDTGYNTERSLHLDKFPSPDTPSVSKITSSLSFIITGSFRLVLNAAQIFAKQSNPCIARHLKIFLHVKIWIYISPHTNVCACLPPNPWPHGPMYPLTGTWQPSPQTLRNPAPTTHLPFCYLVATPCLTLWDPTDCSPPGSSVCGILQAIILEWVAISSSGAVSSRPRDRTFISNVSGIGRWILYHWTSRGAPLPL